MMLQPKVLVADEPTSALDVSIQAQVLNLFMDLQQEFNTAYVFISHNLAVVRHVADTVLVMYLGRPVEMGPKEEIYTRPLHPYTQALLSATPTIHPDPLKPKIKIVGELHNSVAYGQRLWKSHPDGGFNGLGNSPTILIFGLSGSGWMVVVADSNAWV